ncbi:hypothetical protein RUM43_007588 [Polyplax serrata]|uniref:Uncharacterized protein n=1 Tax=Polyplax serrata TaxID=468196 RepID=A0AAN8SA76_POLSC
MLARIRVNADVLRTGNKEMEFRLQNPEKRRDNFRVPVDMQFDPKFWPARGRRGDSELNLHAKTCTEDILQCLNKIQYEYDQKSNGRWKSVNNCSDLFEAILESISEDCIHSASSGPGLVKIIPHDESVSSGRLKRPMYMDILPEYIWPNDKNQFIRPDLSYQEKEKKQNIFWVTRGKRSSF